MKKLWLLPILFLISRPAFASLPYDIYAYWDIDELFIVFNGIASIIGAADFLGLLKTVMFVGAIVAMFSFMGTKQFDGWNWILGSMFIYTLLFLPVGTVVIQDRTGTQPPKTVGNIPVALAAMASLTSHAGDYMTRGTEAVFSVLPDDLKFQKHDYGFGHRVIKESRRMAIADPELRADVIQFIKNCTNYDIMQGRIAYQDIYGGFDPWNTMWLNTSTAHMTMYRAFSGAKTGYCSEVAVGGANVAVQDSLKYRLDNAIDAAQKYYGRILNPDVTDDNIAGALLASQMPNAFMTMLGMSQSASDLIKQNMFVNIWQESGSAIPQMLGDPAAVQVALASAQAAAAANSSYKVTARLAEDTMPKIRNVVELIIYAVFPFIIVFAVVAGNKSGPIFKTYFMSMVWVQLWAPLYAVANLVVTLHSAKKLQAVTMAAHGLAVQTAGALDEMLISEQSMMGYVVVLVPFIAMALTKGGEVAMNSMQSKATAPVDQAASQYGSKVGTGDITMGQISVDTARANMQSWNQYEKPGSITYKNTAGTTQLDTANGEHRQTDNIGKSPIVASSAHQIAQQHVQSASKLESLASTDAKAAEQSMAATLNDTLSAARNTSVQDQSGHSWGTGKTGSHSTQAQVVNEVTDRFAKETGITDKSVAQSAISTILEAKAGVGGGIPFTKIEASVTTALKAEGKQATSNEVQAAVKHANDALDKHGITSADQVVNDYRKSDEFKHLQSSNREAADRIDSGLQKANTYRESSTTAYQQAKEQRETAQRAETLSTSMTADDTVAFNNIRAKMGLAQESDPRKLAPVVEKYLETYKPYYGSSMPTPLVDGGIDPALSTPASLRGEFNATTPGAGKAGLIDADHDNRAKVRQRSGGLDPSAAVGDGGLKGRVEHGQQVAATAVTQADTPAKNGKRNLEGQFQEAKDNTSPTHHLGDQPDKRSAHQQLQKNPAPNKGGSSGKW